MRTFGSYDILFILAAVRWTVLLSVVALALGGLLGALLTWLRATTGALGKSLVDAFLLLGQSTPLLMLLFLVFFGLPVFRIDVNAWWAASIGLALHSAVFLAAIWGSSLEAVPKGQGEAAVVLGLKPLQALILVALPQALRLALPPTVGFCVQLIKATSLASIIGFVELTRAGQIVNNATFEPLKVFALVAAFYFAMCWPLSILGTRMERQLSKSSAR